MSTTPAPRVLGPAFIAPSELDPEFLGFLNLLVEELAEEHAEILLQRDLLLAQRRNGDHPHYPSTVEAAAWKEEFTVDPVPALLQVPTCEMTYPADNERFWKGSLNPSKKFPGIDLKKLQVMPDIEDSLAYGDGAHVLEGLRMIVDGLHGKWDRSPEERVVITPRIRGLGLMQAGVLDKHIPATLFDLAYLAYHLDLNRAYHPLWVYIPKCETAAEGEYLARMLQMVSDSAGFSWDERIRTAHLVESFNLVSELDAFVYNMRDYIAELNLGRYDLLASYADNHLGDPKAVLADAPIPADHPWFMAARKKMVAVGKRRGLVLCGGMTCWFPGDPEADIGQAALDNLERDKLLEFNAGCQRAWAGHPGQISVVQRVFGQKRTTAVPQLLPETIDIYPDASEVGDRTVMGLKEALRTDLLYYVGLIQGRGASLIPKAGGRSDMEDRATGRIWTILATQRAMHTGTVPSTGLDGKPARLSLSGVLGLLSDEARSLPSVLADLKTAATAAEIEEARATIEFMITRRHFDPI